MLIDAKTEYKYWAEAVSAANFVHNRLPSRTIQATPYQMWDGKKPSACVFQIFGTPAYVHIPKEKPHKLESKAKLMMFVGYDEQSKAYRMVDKKTGKIEKSRD